MTAVTVARVVDALQLRRELEHIDERVSVGLVPGGSVQGLPDCKCCSHDDNRPGVVNVAWTPRGGTALQQTDVCVDCAPAAVRDALRDVQGSVYVEIGRWT